MIYIENKKILFTILILILLQISRMLFKYLIFIFLDRSLISDVIVSSIFMIIIIIIIIIKKDMTKINLFPKKFNIKYKLFTIILLLFITITPIITNDYSLYNILSLIYGSIITVIYEEIIFRGFVYKNFSKNKLTAYIVSSILFGIWHLGYMDTIIWRSSLFFNNINILNIMFWKMITGFVYGMVLGFLRYKNKNVYSSIIVHSFINTLRN